MHNVLLPCDISVLTDLLVQRYKCVKAGLNLNFDSKIQFLFFQKSDSLGIEESHDKCSMVLIDVFTCLRSVFCNVVKNIFMVTLETQNSFFFPFCSKLKSIQFLEFVKQL